MPYQFQYVPTSGDLSGMSLEKQTEQAINEIGARADDIQDIADGAVGTANSALVVAQNALTTAQSANTTSQEAKAIAEQASADVQGAYTNAAAAQSRADAAYDLAAEGNTAAAQSRADAAYYLAGTAQSLAQTASSQAESASQAAQNALNVAIATQTFKITDTAEDLNAHFRSPEGLLLTDSDTTNAPSDSVFPIYLSVMLSDDVNHITQISWSEANPGNYFIRTAVKTPNPDPELEDIVTWGDWKALGGGGGSGAIVGEVRLLPFRATELPTGWYFCNGDQYPTAGAVGTVLNALPANLKTDFGIAVSGSNISIPNMFYTDGRGYYLRAVDGTTRQTGSVVTDRMRNLTGTFRGIADAGTGVFSSSPSGTYATSSGANGQAQNMNASRQVPTGPEFSVLDCGMTPAIFFGV